MSFIKYATGQGQLVILKDGIFLVDGGAPTQKREGDRLEKIVGDVVLSWPLRPVDFNSLWAAHARENRQLLESQINLAAGEVIQKPLALVRESKLSSALDIDAKYVSLLKKILFDSGMYFTKIPDEGESPAIAKAHRRERYLNYLEGRLGAEPVEFNPEKLRNLVRNFIDIMRDRPLGQFGAVIGRKINQAVGVREGFFVSGGMGYELKSAPAGADEILHIGGKAYIISDLNFNLPDIDGAFKEYFSEFAEAEGIKRAADRAGEIDIGVDKREFGILISALKKGINRTTLDFDDWGITLNTDGMTVYLKVPEYALKDWLGSEQNCYLMPACKVAVKVYRDLQKTGEEVTPPFALGSTTNPFVSGQNICLGTARSNLNANLPLHLRIVKYISEGHKIITTGYSRTDNFTPSFKLSQLGKKFIRSEEDLREAGIPITNGVKL
ncbi:MAG: hypothetical protein HY438_04420 [DPANN group archaeon]|nr:hypothetical protein [DPANN group archaeon]